MSISFPRTDILSSLRITAGPFRLVSRQEMSRQANGVSRGKDFGSPLWFFDCTSAPIYKDDAPGIEAPFHSLDGVINTFEAGDLRRPYPRAHADGNFVDGGTLHTVDASRKSIRLNNLGAGFQLSVGDYLAFNYGAFRALHQVMEAATADGAGLTPLFEVRPHVRDGYTLTAAVTLKNPKGIFTLLPDSYEPQVQGAFTVINFKAVQYL